MKGVPALELAAKFGPILKAAFPNEHTITRGDVAFQLAEIALSTPTSQPPAAETRLREVAETLRKEAFLLLHQSEGCALNHYGNDHELFGSPGWLVDSRKRIEDAAAALTQPEPTAQQEGEVFGYGADGEPMRRFKGAGQVLSDALSAQQATDEGAGGYPPFVWFTPADNSSRKYIRDDLAGQQAAGEAEAVAWMYEKGDRTCIWRERAGPGEMCHTPGWTETPLYATPQPTETQRIVAWQPIETAPEVKGKYFFCRVAWGPEWDKCAGDAFRWNGRWFAAAVFHKPGVGVDQCQQEFRMIEVQPTHWMRNADAIERGEHLAGDKA